MSGACLLLRYTQGYSIQFDRVSRCGLQHLQMFDVRQNHLRTMTCRRLHDETGFLSFIVMPLAFTSILHGRTKSATYGSHGREVCCRFGRHGISLALERPVVVQNDLVFTPLSKALERLHEGQKFHWRLRFALRVGAKLRSLITDRGRNAFEIMPSEASHVLACE